MNLDRPWLQFDGFAVPRQVVGPLALDLDRGVLRRGLLDEPREPRQQGGNRLRRGFYLAGLSDTALGVVGIAFLPPGDRKAIALAAIHHERNGIGGFPERDR